MTALGLIEVRGLLAAIEAADAMLKAADVRLLERNLAGGGLVTITVAGEVAAVQAAVEAAVASVRRIQGADVLAGHVIPRPDAEIARVLVIQPTACSAPDALLPSAPSVSGSSATGSKQAPAEEGGAPTAETTSIRYTLAQLKKMNLRELRQIAGDMTTLPFPRKKVPLIGKKPLIEAIMNAYLQKEE